MTLAEWREVMAINLDGTFLCTREAARHMVARGEGGALVIVSSISARFGAPTMQHYAATKAALVSLSHSLAVELAPHRIRCNALLPGWTDTEMADEWLDDPRFVEVITRRTPARRWGVPADYARDRDLPRGPDTHVPHRRRHHRRRRLHRSIAIAE